MKTAFAPKFLQFLLLPLFVFVLNVGWGQTTLPVARTSWNSAEPTGWSQTGTTDRTTTFACSGSDAATFDGTGDVTTVNFNSTPNQLVFKLKKSSMSGESKMTVARSDDGTTYVTLGEYGTASGATTITDCANITLSLTSGTRYVRWTYTKATGNCDLDDVSISAAATPTISSSGTLSALSTTYGTASSNTTFSVSGANMSAGILVTPPTGYEVCLTSNGTYTSTVTVGTSGTISSTSVYVRLAAATAVGSYSGNIVLSSTSATSVNVATVSSAVSAKALTITGLSAANKNYDGNTAVSVSGTAAYSGLANSESFPTVSTSGTVSWVFPSSSVGNYTLTQTNTYTAPSSNYTVTQPSLTASINAIVPTAPIITGITAGSAQLSVAFTAPSSNGGASITNYEYSTDGGSNWTTPSPVVTTSPFTISGLLNGTTYDIQIRAVNSAGYGAASATAQGTPAAPSSPTISGAATATAFTTTYGTASTPQSFSITGSALTNDIIATAPTGFEVSSDGTVYGSTATFVQSGGSTSGTLRIRLTATAGVSGSYNSQNIVLSSTGASSINITTSSSGNTVSQKALAITAATIASKVYNRSTASGTVTPGTLSGFVGSETLVVSSAVGTYADWNVGTGKSATIVYTLANGTNGGLATNYTLANTVGTGNITGKALTITSPAVTSKTYDGNTTATITGTLSVVESGDAVTLSGTGTFASANVGTGSVTSTSTLVGADEGNYSLTQPTGLTGEITLKSLTITATDVSKEMGVLLTGGAGSTAFTSTGLAGSETIGSVTITYGAAAGTTGQGATFGTYSGQVTPSAATGGTFNAANYSITYSSGSITVSGFTPGNIVVNRIGNGSTTLTSAASSVNVLELNTSGITQQTISTLFTGSNLLTETGTGTSNGNLNSYNTLLGVSGYNSALGTASVNSSNTKATNILGTGATVVNRVVFPTSGSPLPFTGDNFRSIIPTSLTTFYASGNGSSSTGGIWYYNGTSYTQVSTTQTNTRNVEIFNGNLYFSTGSGTKGIYQVGSGLPTASGQTATLIAAATSPYGFSISPDGNTMYVADDGTVNGNTGGGIQKWTKSGSTWTRQYTFAVQARGITVDYSGNNSVIYATTVVNSPIVDNNRIIKIEDTGSSASSSDVLSAGSNYIFRGVDFAPAAAPVAPTIGTITQTTCSTSTGSVELTGLPSGQWRIYGFPSGSAVGTGSSTTISGLSAGSYTFLVTSYTGRTSEVSASVTINAQPSTPSAPTSPVNASRCGTGTVVLSASVPAGITIDWYSAATGGTLLLSGNSSYTTASISSTTIYYAESKNTTTGCVSATRTAATVTIITPEIPSVSIASSDANNSICPNETVTFTATATNGGTAPTYQWKLNGSNVDGTSSTYETSSLSNSDVITVVMTANNSCQSPNSATSNAITTAVNTPPAALSLTGSSYCAYTNAIPNTTYGSITSSNSVSGISYTLFNVNGDEVLTYAGTGSALVWTGAVANAGYSVIGVNTSTGCVGETSTATEVIQTTATIPLYTDADGDNFGTGSASGWACTAFAPAGYSLNTGDCNNSDSAIKPTAVEICGNGIDENCTGASDDAPISYKTVTSGNWGDASTWEMTCNAGSAYVAATYAPVSYFTGITSIQNAHDIIIPADGVTYQTGTLEILNGGSLTFNGNGFINIPTAGTVSPIAKLTVTQSINNSGTLTIGHQASLAQSSTTAANTGSGTVNVETKLTGSNINGTAPNGRYWYIGSPMNNTVGGQFFDTPSMVRLWSYNGSNNSWGAVVHSTSNPTVTTALNLVPGIGYLYRAGANKTITYVGTAAANLNNNITSNLLNPTLDGTWVPVVGYQLTGYKFVANPYPSYIDWKLVTRSGLNVSYWIRNANNSAYDAYNATTNVSSGSSGQTTQFIPPMQGFYVYAFNSTPSLRIDNTDRVHSSNVLHAPTVNQVVRLKLNDGKSSDYTVVYENEVAANDYEEADTDKMFDYDFHQLYTLEGEHELALNGLSNATAKGSVDMGISVANSGQYTIEATDLEVEEDVILEDKFNHTFQDMKVNSIYSFTSQVGTFNERFVLHFTAIETEIVGVTEREIEGVRVYKIGPQQVKVCVMNTAEYQGANVKVYDAIGNLIERKNMTSNELVLDLDIANGIYVVEVTGTNKTFTKKVFITK